MSRVTMKNGVGFSKYSSAVYMDLSVTSGDGDPGSAPAPARDIENTVKFDPLQVQPFAIWGDDNLLPQQLTLDIETCGILNAIIDMKARFALCNGILPAACRYNQNGEVEIVNIINDGEIKEFLDRNNMYFNSFAWLKDFMGFRNGVARYMLNKGRDKIATMQRDDVTEMRYQLMDQVTGDISNIYLSASWDRIGKTIGTDNKQYLRTINLLDPRKPVADLEEKMKSTSEVEFAMTFRHPAWGKKYYSMPLWYAARKWVRIAQRVPEFKEAIFKHAIQPQYMVLINKNFWTNYFSQPRDGKKKNISEYSAQELEDLKNNFYDSIDKYLTGSENAGKAIFSEFDYSTDGKMMQDIEIKVIDNNMPEGQYLPESAVANSEIAFAEMFNPSIIGSNLPTGPYTNSQGGSNVREGILMQVIMHEFERKVLQQIMSVPKYINGWAKDYQTKDTFFEFIIPATIPTTLDTGASTKPMLTGSGDTKTPDSNGTN